MSWQPIETAPRDGATVLGYFADRKSGVMFDLIRWMEAGENSDWHYDGTYHHAPGHPQPTHWMVIPDPPAGAGSDL